MNQDLDFILEFLSGKIGAKEFEERLYASETIEEYLSDDPNLPHDSYIQGDNYLFLISQNYNNPGGVVNAQGALEQFLDRKGIKYKSSDIHHKLYNLILKSQPKWLDIDSMYISEKYFSKIIDLNSKEASKELKAMILSDFKYIKSPPKWLQSPDWPIVNDVPLIFMGQLKIEKYFHDEAAIYVFYDANNGKTETIIQVC